MPALAFAAVPKARAISSKFYGLDVIRGVATCVVALAHVAYRTGEPRWGGQKAFGGALDGLYIFVDFFFVLSGFLITWVHWRDLGIPDRLSNYVQRRLSRIYPVYWVVLTLYVVGQLVMPSQTHEVIFSVRAFIGSYSLICGLGPNLLGVAWTLYFEILGYVFFALMICVHPKLGFGLLALWVVAIAVHYSSHDTQYLEQLRSDGSPVAIMLHPYNLQFLMGILLAAAMRKGYQVPMPFAVCAIGVLLFLASVVLRPDNIFSHNQLFARLSLGLFACMTIGGLVSAERYQAFSIPDWMQRFGAGSYSIYLTHTLVEPPVQKLAWPVLRHLPPEIWIFIVAGVAIGVGYAFHRTVELPLTNAVKRLVVSPEAKPPILTTT